MVPRGDLRTVERHAPDNVNGLVSPKRRNGIDIDVCARSPKNLTSRHMFLPKF